MKTTSTRITLNTAEETKALGALLAQHLNAGTSLLLKGEMGAGKTTLAQGCIQALTNTPQLEVTSPTFSLVNIYDSDKGKVWHFDLYRIEDDNELPETGIFEALEDITLIEWPERIESETLANAIIVTLTYDNDQRNAEISSAISELNNTLSKEHLLNEQ